MTALVIVAMSLASAMAALNLIGLVMEGRDDDMSAFFFLNLVVLALVIVALALSPSL